MIRPVLTRADRKSFVELAYRINAGDPNWVPPLRSEVYALISPTKNAWFTHAEAQLFIAEAGGRVTGRISAHIDTLALKQPPEQGFGPGTGNWGLIEAEDEATFHALIARAEAWLRDKDMTRVLAPVSLSIWEEPGLLVKGFEEPPTVMMGHHRPEYRAWIASAGYAPAKSLYTYDLDITVGLPPLVARIVASGERNSRIVVRKVDKRKFDTEAAILIGILNDAWSSNWGFVPLTDPEIADIGKKLRPIAFEDMIMIGEVDGEPVAFMIMLPDLNEVLMGLRGSLFPFGWAKILLWLRKPKVRTMRVPLLGVVKRLQSSRLASQVAFMLIEYIRRVAVAKYGASRGEIGWILEDNQGMIAIAEMLDTRLNREYVIYQKSLAAD